VHGYHCQSVNLDLIFYAEATRLLDKDGISLKDNHGKSTKPQEQKGEDTKGEDLEKHGIGAKLKSAIHKE